MKPVGQGGEIDFPAIERARHVTAVEIARVVDLAPNGIDQWVVIDGVGLALEGPSIFLQSVEKGAETLRRAAQRVGRLNRFLGADHALALRLSALAQLSAEEVEVANIAAGTEKLAAKSCRGDLARMVFCPVNGVFERVVSGAKRLQCQAHAR